MIMPLEIGHSEYYSDYSESPKSNATVFFIILNVQFQLKFFIYTVYIHNVGNARVVIE